jgi:hypothetical protein
MAYIIPSDITQLALGGGHAGELETLQLLKLKLPSDYTVFHGVHWSREYAGYTVYGEVDFVVINRSGEVLLIEQKNGRLDEAPAGLLKVYNGKPKNVGDQIKRSIDKVKEKFSWTHQRKGHLKLDYLIYCPDHRVKDVNSAALDLSRIVDASASSQLCARIEKILGAGNTDDEPHYNLVFSFFQQTFEIVPDIHAHISSHEKSFTRLSSGLVQAVQNIQMEPLRLRIDGTAGSGKSAAGRLFFDQALSTGHRPLFVCYNRPLAERLKYTVGKGGYVSTWYGLCSKFLEDRGHTIDYQQMYSDSEFWTQIQELVLAEIVPEEWLFDFLIVDEGQDFEPAWFDLLQTFVKDGAGVLWLQDEDQKIRKDGEGDVGLLDFVGYRCRTNYRTPESIARFMMRYSPYSFECANDLPGLGVGVHRYKKADEQSKIVSSIVRERVQEGFALADIVVLSCRGIKSSIFGVKNRIGEFTLRRFAGEYDMFGNQVMTSGKILFDTIYRFKGQQAPAVIVVDMDPDPNDIERSWKVLHAGMTRATVRLDLVTKDDNPITREFSAW